MGDSLSLIPMYLDYLGRLYNCHVVGDYKLLRNYTFDHMHYYGNPPMSTK